MMIKGVWYTSSDDMSNVCISGDASWQGIMSSSHAVFMGFHHPTLAWCMA